MTSLGWFVVGCLGGIAIMGMIGSALRIRRFERLRRTTLKVVEALKRDGVV